MVFADVLFEELGMLLLSTDKISSTNLIVFYSVIFKTVAVFLK